MVWQPTPQQIVLGVGTNGALTDVSPFVVGPEGTSYSWGRQSEFRDPSPAQLTFVLENQDGRFTPGNTSSPYATPLSEGTAACWAIGPAGSPLRLFGGTVSAITFASSEQEWGRVTITVSDVFYIANRTQISGPLAGAIAAAEAINYWPLTDPAGSGQALEASGGPTLYPDPYAAPVVTFGAPANGPAADTQMVMSGTNVNLGTLNLIGTQWGAVGTFGTTPYPSGSAGAWGVWVTLSTLTDVFSLLVQFGVSSTWTLDVNGITPGSITLKLFNAGGAFTLTIPQALIPGQAYYLAFALTYVGSPSTMTATVYLNGVSIGSQTYAAGGIGAGPNGVRITTSGTVTLSHLTHSQVLVHEEFAGPTTAANRLTALAQVIPSIALGSIDPNVSPATLGVLSSGSSLWNALCDLVRTEQGHLYTATSGSLLAPLNTVNLRARTRPTSVTLTLDAAADLEGVPPFDRDITNMYGVVSATGPGSGNATVTDQAAVARVGTASTSESTDLVNYIDLLGYAQDRMIRGENVALKVAQLVVNTATSSKTLAQMVGLNLGDRIRVTNLPSGPLGFTQWDGWFLGASEVHNYLGDVFTLYVAPVLPATGVFDTDLFAAGTDLTLNGAVTATATSFSVLTANLLTFLETVQVPYTIQIDQEQVTVTACTALSGSTQTVTVTRGANGTTAAAHTSGALVELANPPIFAF